MAVLKAKTKPKQLGAKKVITKFRPFVNSRHPSHSWLRDNLPLFPFRAIIRLGSTKTLQEAYPTKTVEQRSRIKEINSIQGVKNSSSKLLMKQCFTRAGVKTTQWWTTNNGQEFRNSDNTTFTFLRDLSYPIVAKGHYGSRGDANYKLNNQQELETWMRGKNLSNYIFEKFHNYSKEYRLHVTNEGCFYTCRKLVRNDAPEGTWQRHDDVCTWIVEENPKFMKPSTWSLIVQDCIKAKNALGLDICAFDVLVQGTSKTNPEWLLLESCSAPSFGEITKVKYKEAITKLLLQ